MFNSITGLCFSRLEEKTDRHFIAQKAAHIADGVVAVALPLIGILGVFNVLPFSSSMSYFLIGAGIVHASRMLANYIINFYKGKPEPLLSSMQRAFKILLVACSAIVILGATLASGKASYILTGGGISLAAGSLAAAIILIFFGDAHKGIGKIAFAVSSIVFVTMVTIGFLGVYNISPFPSSYKVFHILLAGGIVGLTESVLGKCDNKFNLLQRGATDAKPLTEIQRN